MYKEDRQEERNAARGVGNHVGADLGETVRLVLARHVDEGVVQGHLQGVWRPTESVKWVLNLGCARRGGQDAGRALAARAGASCVYCAALPGGGRRRVQQRTCEALLEFGGTWVVAPGGWEVLFPVNPALLVSAGGGDLQELAHFPRLSAT